MDSEGNILVLETLREGDSIGQFSVLFETKLVFRIMAKTTSVRYLTLDDTFFVEYGDKDYGDKDTLKPLKEAIQEANNYEKEFGLPICDFQKYPFEEDTSNMMDRPKEIRIQHYKSVFKTMGKRMILLSKMNKLSRQQFEISVNSTIDKAQIKEQLKEMKEMKEKQEAEEEEERRKIESG